MRENRPYGSEGGEGQLFPTPIRRHFTAELAAWVPALRSRRLARPG
jgi:hypothetical protein